MSRKFEGNGQGTDNRDEDTLGSFYMGRMQPPPENERVLPRGLLASIVVVIFAGIIWYAYPGGGEHYDAGDVPVIKADAAPYKFTPDDPGGMEVRHQDSTVFNPLVKKSADDVERLLPRPEEPMDKQDAIQAGDAAPAAKPAEKAGLNLEPAPEDGGAGTEKVVMSGDAAKKQPLTEMATAPAATVPEASADTTEKTTPAVQQDEAVSAKPEAKVESAVKETADPAPAAGGFYIQLGAFRDKSKADEEWKKLQKKFPAALSGLSSRVEKADLGAKGIWYRLHAGPVAESKARAVCAGMKADGAGCMVRKL